MTLLDHIWEQMEPTVFITREEFERDLERWDIEPVEVNGKVAFAAFTNGAEFHYATFGTGARITRTMIWSRLNPILDRHGFVTTRTPLDDVRQQRLNRALGFVETGADEFFLHFRMDKQCQ